MNKKMTLIGSSLLLLFSPVSQADNNLEVKNQAQQQVQAQTRNMSAEKNAGQSTHLQNMESMSEQERTLYQQLNSSKKEDGNKNSYGKGNGDGSGKKKRQGQSEDRGAGSGYGSRGGGGGGGGGGRGRGY